MPRGCAFGYLGPNGAGKTTLIRLLLGLTRADAGSMSLLGLPVPSNAPPPWRGSVRSSTSRGFTGHLTGRQNLRVIASAREPEAQEPHSTRHSNVSA